MTRQIIVTPPAGGGADVVFAAVRVETLAGETVGAETCIYVERVRGELVSRQKTSLAATVKSDADALVLRWVYEDSSRGTLPTKFKGTGRRRLGGT